MPRPNGVGSGVGSVKPGPAGGTVAIPGSTGVDSAASAGVDVGGTATGVDVGGTLVSIGIGGCVGVFVGVDVEADGTTVDVGGTLVGIGLGVSVGVSWRVGGVFVEVGGTTMTLPGVFVAVGNSMMMIPGVLVGVSGATWRFGAATAGRSCSAGSARNAPTRTTVTKITALATALRIFLPSIGICAPLCSWACEVSTAPRTLSGCAAEASSPIMPVEHYNPNHEQRLEDE